MNWDGLRTLSGVGGYLALYKASHLALSHSRCVSPPLPLNSLFGGSGGELGSLWTNFHQTLTKDIR